MSDFLSKPWSQIAAAVILPNLAGYSTGVLTRNQIKNW